MKGRIVGARSACAFYQHHHLHSTTTTTTLCNSRLQPNFSPQGPILGSDSLRRYSQQQPQREKDDYYSLLLSSPLPTTTPSSSDPLPPSPSSSKPAPAARIIFGSQLAGPAAAAREKEGWAATRPKEPDNCCMSGCVNCVWDAYREEVEEWAMRRRMEAQERGRESVEGGGGGEDGGTSGDGVEGMVEGVGDLFEQVPVGIREFMILEKRLREVEEKRNGGKTR